MIPGLRALLLLTLAPGVMAQIRIPASTDRGNLFLSGWLEEQLSRDIPAALALYQRAADDRNRSSNQRALALARLGEQHWVQGRNQELQATYRSLAGLGIDLGVDRGGAIPAGHARALGQLGNRFREALAKPAGSDRDEALSRLRGELQSYLEGIRRQEGNPRLLITPKPLLERVLQHERRPREPAPDKELQSLHEARLKALQEGDHVAARRLQQHIDQKRSQHPARNVSIQQRMRGKRMAWITELHLRAVSPDDTDHARQQESMLFRLPKRQEAAVDRQLRFLRRRSTTDEQRLQALGTARLRVQRVAGRPSISQWEREVLNDLDARLRELAELDEVMEALELVARLPYRYELLQDRSRG